jgi:hypothetical protein
MKRKKSETATPATEIPDGFPADAGSHAPDGSGQTPWLRAGFSSVLAAAGHEVLREDHEELKAKYAALLLPPQKKRGRPAKPETAKNREAANIAIYRYMEEVRSNLSVKQKRRVTMKAAVTYATVEVFAPVLNENSFKAKCRVRGILNDVSKGKKASKKHI